ncbi:uncharacterized protein LOC136083630 [Hydra vulgaris]|uniref:Uncharacterized protein LOC136083630 n=1 Tax=Hydra vulgaris TaxID=6087 RepID=A0ABM4CBX6_HYDVU
MESDLQNFLSKRLINQTGNKATLEKNAYCLNLQAQVQSAQNEENEFKNDKLNKKKTSSKLIVDPKSLTYGWVIGPSLFPDVTYAEVQLYLNKRNARKAFRSGKSLFKSDHLSNIRYHNINSDSKYCYIAAYCLPEKKSNNPVYNVWVLIKKKSGTIKSADCNCAAGISGCCIHVGALLWYVEHSVKIGDNITCTSKPLEWLKTSKKVQKLYGPSMLSEIEIVKPLLKDTLMFTRKRLSNRLSFDPRAINQQEVSMTKEDVDSLAQITNYNCVYVMLMQTKNVVPVPDISNVAQEIEVKTSLHPSLPKTPYEVVTYLDCKITYKVLLMQLATNFDEISELEHLTIKQSCNNDWHKHRKGRHRMHQKFIVLFVK